MIVSSRGYLQAVGNQCEFICHDCEQKRCGILNESEQRNAIFASRPDYVCKLLQVASHAGIDSNAQTSLNSIGSCELRACPSGKPPKTSRCLEPPCKPGAYGTTPLICVRRSPTFFRAAPDWHSYTAS